MNMVIEYEITKHYIVKKMRSNLRVVSFPPIFSELYHSAATQNDFPVAGDEKRPPLYLSPGTLTSKNFRRKGL